MGFSSFKGNTSQRRSNRPPMGDTVLSMTSNSDLPSSCMGWTNSRLRIVNLSSRTYLSSSIREIEVIWPIWVCWVCSRYWRMAPAAMTPDCKWSTPKPFRFFTLKCLSNFCLEVCSVNTQSSSWKVKYFVPNKRSNSCFLLRSWSTSFGEKLPKSFST